jgi:hypothetical protein
MVGYSLRLALTAGGIGLLMVASAQLQATGAAVLIVAATLLAAAVRWYRTHRAWASPQVRTRALLTVAMG